jgi:hypothetical protein
MRWSKAGVSKKPLEFVEHLCYYSDTGLSLTGFSPGQGRGAEDFQITKMREGKKMESQATFPTISHRVASGYLKFLAGCGAGQGQAAVDGSKLDLHSFFKAFYEKLYQQPDLFGLPLREDDCIEEGEPHEKERKQEVTARLKAPKEMVASGLDFLAGAGIQGQLVGDDLVVEQGAALIKQTKVKRKFLQGLESAGLAVLADNDRVTLRNSQFPAMLPALQALARACAQYPRQQENQFHFARCDFRVLDQPGYCPEAMQLYRESAGEDLDRLTALHEYFTGLGYRTITGISEPFFWIVQYQGNRKVKATPLLQVEYQDRYCKPLRVQIKCASTGRIAALLPHQSQALQDDFMRRAFPCRGDECGWCRNNKNLGPTVVTYQGEEKTLCWYSFPEVHGFDDRSVDLLEEYARMHEQLLTAV